MRDKCGDIYTPLKSTKEENIMPIINSWKAAKMKSHLLELKQDSGSSPKLNKLFSLIILSAFCFGLAMQKTSAEVLSYKALTIASKGADFAKIGLQKTAVKNAFSSLSKDDFADIPDDRFFISKLNGDDYLLIIDSWQVCGTAGCEGYIFALKDKKLLKKSIAEGRFFCSENEEKALCNYHVETYDFYRLDSKDLPIIGLQPVVKISNFKGKDAQNLFITQSSSGAYLLLTYDETCNREGQMCRVDNLIKNADGSFSIAAHPNYDMTCYDYRGSGALTCMSKNRFEERLEYGKDFATGLDNPKLWRR